MKTIHNILWRIHTKYKHMWRRTCIQMPNVKLCSYALQSVTDEVETAASLNQSPCSPGGWACQVYSHRSQSSQSNTSKHATIVAVLTSLINTGVCVCVCAGRGWPGQVICCTLWGECCSRCWWLLLPNTLQPRRAQTPPLTGQERYCTSVFITWCDSKYYQHCRFRQAQHLISLIQHSNMYAGQSEFTEFCPNPTAFLIKITVIQLAFMQMSCSKLVWLWWGSNSINKKWSGVS